jgi:hypothetical protein
MADEKKPKIDLKARLGKAGAQNQPAAPASGSLPAPALSNPAPSGSLPAPAMGMPDFNPNASGGIPGAPSSAADVLGGLGGLGHAASPFRPQPQARPAPQAAPVSLAPPPPQRIEVDDTALNEARKSSLKKAVGIGAGLALVVGAIGFVAGGAGEKSNARTASVESAKELAKDVETSKASLDVLVKKLEAGRALLNDKDKKAFPDSLATELGGLKVDFDGQKLAGRRFSGFKVETTRNLVQYITSIQEVNDKRERLQRVLGALQKPFTEAAQGRRSIVNFVTLQKDAQGNLLAGVTPLSTPIKVENDKFELPKDGYEYTEGRDDKGKDVKKTIPKYTTGALDKPYGAYIPASDGNSAKTQLNLQIADMLVVIKGMDGQSAGVDDQKATVMKQADMLILALKEVK